MTGDSDIDIMLDSDRQNQPAQEIKATLSRIRQSAESILPDKAKSNPSERNQMYDLIYAPAVAEEQTSSPARAHQSSVKKGLAFLFGDDS